MLHGAPGVDIVQIKPSGIGVDLQSRTALGTHLDQRLQIDVVALAPADQPSGRVADHVDVRIAGRGDQSGGHLLASLAEAAVDRGNHQIQLGQDLIGKVQRSIGANLQLDPVEQAGTVAPPVDRSNELPLLGQSLGVEAVGHTERLGVVGEHKVLVATRARRFPHLLDRRLAIAPVRVTV